MTNTLITSYLDKDYYIINNEDINIFYLMTIITEADSNDIESVSNDILSQYWQFLKEGNNQKLFVSKTSKLGETLTQLIKIGKIEDETVMLRKEVLVNALLHSIKEDPGLYSLTRMKIVELIDSGMEGNIDTSFGERYDPYDLAFFVEMGRKNQSYLEKLNPKLSGYEESGVIEQNGNIYNFNIVTKEINKIDSKKRVRKI